MCQNVRWFVENPWFFLRDLPLQPFSKHPTILRHTFWPGAALARQCPMGAGFRRSVISDGLSLCTPVKFGNHLIQRLGRPKTASNTISSVRPVQNRKRRVR